MRLHPLKLIIINIIISHFIHIYIIVICLKLEGITFIKESIDLTEI